MKQLLDINETAEQLGLSRWTITAMLESGALPGLIVKSGKRKKVWRVREEALQKWIEAREQETKKTLQSSRTARPALAVVDGGGQQ